MTGSEKYNSLSQWLRKRDRPLIAFLIMIGVIAIYADLAVELRKTVNLVIGIFQSGIFRLFVAFLVAGFLLILPLPLMNFLVGWITYETSSIYSSLRLRSVYLYLRYYVTSFELEDTLLTIGLLRTQLRQGFSKAVLALGSMIYLFLVILLIWVLSALPTGEYELPVDLYIIWTIFIGILGSGIPLGIFFIQYVNEDLFGISLSEYLKTHTLIIMVGVLSTSNAILFTFATLYYEEPQGSLTGAAGFSLLFSIASLVLLYFLLLIVPLRDPFRGIRRKAAESVIHLHAFSEIRDQIYNEAIKRYTATKPISKNSQYSRIIESNDIGLDPGEYVTDINLERLKKSLNSHQILYFDLLLPIGDRVLHKNTPVAAIATKTGLLLENYSGFEELCRELNSAFIIKEYTHKYSNPNDSPSNYLAFDSYIVDLEKECKNSINDNNHSRFVYRFQTYLDFLFFMSNIEKQQSKSENEIKLPYDKVYTSMSRVLHQLDSSNSSSLDDTKIKMGIAAIDAIYYHYFLVRKNLSNHTYREYPYSLFCSLQEDICNEDIVERVEFYINHMDSG